MATHPAAHLESGHRPPGEALGGANPRPRKLRVLRWLPERWVLTTGPANRQVLYLTFDDGPHPEHTPRLLDLLAEHDARATFFLIGEHAERHPDIASRLVREGHGLGNHSWSHPHFDRITQARQLEEIDRTDRLLQSLDGRDRHDFRPPRGATPIGLMIDCLRRGRRVAYWSYDSLDYTQRAPADLIAGVRSRPVQAGEVVLMHDDSAHSLELLRVMIPEWKAAGYGFEPLPVRRGRDDRAGGASPDASARRGRA